MPDITQRLACKLDRIASRRAVLLAYLKTCIEIEDWHGVQDAASDLREVDTAVRTIEYALQSMTFYEEPDAQNDPTDRPRG